MAYLNKFGVKLSRCGLDLVRPECVLATASGEMYVSDFRGGVTCIQADGQQLFMGGSCAEVGTLKTNGFALLNDKSVLIAHLGDEYGGVFQIKPNGQIRPFLMEADGVALPPSNFVHLDHQGRIWITISTRLQPRALAYNSTVKDGFIVLFEQGRGRIVADGLGYTNECWVNPQGTKLYANATFSRELLCFDIAVDGSLSNQQIVTTFGEGTFPDGLNADIDGNFWVTSIVSNRVIKVNRDGEQEVYLEDSNDGHLDRVEQAFQSQSMGRNHLDNNPASQLKNISSLAFAGPKLDQLYLGCLLDTCIFSIRNSGIKGVAPAHWLF